MKTRDFPDRANATQPRPAPCVLLVEDDAGCRDTLALLLAMEGVRVVGTSSGSHAARLAREQTFDVIFTDLHLPDVPGAMLIRELATSAAGCPRIAVVTGASEVDIGAAIEAGAGAVFRKPFHWADMTRYLSTLASPRAPLVAVVLPANGTSA